MAEIPVEKKSSKAWLWILLALIVLGLLIWWATDSDGDEVETDTVATQSVATSPAADGTMSISAILANPGQYVGRDDFEGNVGVSEVSTDRGFWVEDQGQRLFALIVDEPREVPLDINAGQQLHVTQGKIRDASFLSDLPGESIDDDTRRIIEQQDAYLVVDEENIEITSNS